MLLVFYFSLYCHLNIHIHILIIKVGKYGSICEFDSDCLKNAECKSKNDNSDKKYCQCSTKDRTIYKPDYEPFRQCRLLVGAKCNG